MPTRKRRKRRAKAKNFPAVITPIAAIVPDGHDQLSLQLTETAEQSDADLERQAKAAVIEQTRSETERNLKEAAYWEALSKRLSEEPAVLRIYITCIKAIATTAIMSLGFVSIALALKTIRHDFRLGETLMGSGIAMVGLGIAAPAVVDKLLKFGGKEN